MLAAYQRSLEEFEGLSCRTQNILRRQGLYTVDQVRDVFYSLNTKRGVGPKTLKELDTWLNEKAVPVQMSIKYLTQTEYKYLHSLEKNGYLCVQTKSYAFASKMLKYAKELITEDIHMMWVKGLGCCIVLDEYDGGYDEKLD